MFTDFAQTIDIAMMEYHSKTRSMPVPIFDGAEEEGYKFGILTIKTNKVEIIQNTIFFVFSLDTSGSMDEISDGTFRPNSPTNFSKLDYLKQSFNSMLRYFAENNSDTLQFVIRVHTFSTEVTVLLRDTPVTKDNVDYLIAGIDAIRADGSTNIGSAVESANAAMTEYHSHNRDHDICHIFMTDGQATAGLMSKPMLVDIINTEVAFPTLLCGIGRDHNSDLLQEMSKHYLREYQFINNMEHTGLIYGETIHRFLYAAIKRPHIVMSGAEIYDWQTNKWTTDIRESAIVGDIVKTYHVRSRDADKSEAQIYGFVDANNAEVLFDTAYSLPELVCANASESTDYSTDLSNYIFRQRTLELLFEMRGVSPNTRRAVKHKALAFFTQMREYMKANMLSDDAFMKQLCDDIHISYKLLDTVEGVMYTSARQSSQGRQRSYNTSANVDDDLPEPPTLHRSNAMAMPPLMRTNSMQSQIVTPDDYFAIPMGLDASGFYESELSPIDRGELSEMDTYMPSRELTNAYATPAIMRTMTAASQSTEQM